MDGRFFSLIVVHCRLSCTVLQSPNGIVGDLNSFNEPSCIFMTSCEFADKLRYIEYLFNLF